MGADQILAIVISGIAIMPLIIISIVMLCGKGAGLIAGYNTMNKDDKKKINAKALCKFIGLMLLFLIAFLVIFITGAVLGNVSAMIAGGLMFGVTVIFTLILANTKMFKNKN